MAEHSRAQSYQMELRWRLVIRVKNDKSGFSLWFIVILNVFHIKMINFYRKVCKLVPNQRLSLFLIFTIFAVLLLLEIEFFPFCLLLREIWQVLSGKMATNELKIS